MAMKKVEMERHYNEYNAVMSEAQSAEKNGLPREAVRLALSNMDNIDGMMQYSRKYLEKEFDSIEAIELVLKYAPFLLDATSLGKFETLLKSNRRIEKHTTKNLADRIAVARSHLWDAHRLWDHLENHADTREAELHNVLGGQASTWRKIVSVWDQMKLIQRANRAGELVLTLSTSMGRIVSAKCYSCGETTEAPKAMFLEEILCPSCEVRGYFVILMQTEKT